jgi:hypothetical protein
MTDSSSAPATPAAGLSRRALFGVGGSTLLVATAATVWRWRLQRAEAATPSRSNTPIAYADHDGWMVTLAEKRALLLPPPGQSR